ncbi:hypothetical protein N7456_001058 [Penicillium angulare]|uniref:Uncharacterized protein n=1 Tax=Penicillium angulare TaxID=116970 RepID=A0A9W9GEA7_9EURO|nr:hypothetical protein N7456_001058 [Penicillium angulare]
MDKVWFKLRQTDYPAPPEESMLSGPDENTSDRSPINLGHIIPDLKQLDCPLNADSRLPFPLRMQVHRTEVTNFAWSKRDRADHSVALALGAPVASAAIGVTAGPMFNLAFKNATEQHESYDHLDTYIVNPTEQYVSDCLEELDNHITSKGSWTVFMITGLKIARPRSRKVEHDQGKTYLRFCLGCDEDKDLDIEKVLEAEGLDNFKVLVDDDLDEALVMNSNDAGKISLE